ncbi:hypothetical protein LTR66_000181 [Elasticomyces elasticus]|nr:hypothetical protein LTR66_000181 [Elasticomyces elasticus]
MGVFHSAAKSVALVASENKRRSKRPLPGQVPPADRLSIDAWTRAIIGGVDDRSPKWKHLLVLGGLLLGFSNEEGEQLSQSLRIALEGAVVKATNLKLQAPIEQDELSEACIVLVLNHSFPLLAEPVRSELDYDRLLPVLMNSTFHSSEGLASAYFLGTVDLDIRQTASAKFSWSAKATSYQQTQKILSGPLISAFGPLSRLIAHVLENVGDPGLVKAAVEDLVDFSRTLHLTWRQNKLSEIDPSEEDIYLDQETCKTTLPTLWRLLKASLFAIVILLRATLGRLLGDGNLASGDTAPTMATQSLSILRNLHFISSRLGSTSLSQYTFVSLTAIDILSTYPAVAEAFLYSIKPNVLGQIPPHPLDRQLDLYFLDTAEHFALTLSPPVNEELLIAAAMPYLAAGGSNRLLPIFEAAHSMVLAVLAAPQSADLAAKHLPFYADALFQVFPTNLSPRQFRFAYRTLLKIIASPSPLLHTQPLLPATLLEFIRARACYASVTPLEVDPASPASNAPNDSPPLSEQAVLTLTLIDTLSCLPIGLLDEWLPLAAELVNAIDNDGMREQCKDRFWEILQGGEMSSDKAMVCVGWWSTGGGREMLLYGRRHDVRKGAPAEDSEELMMSGALPPPNIESKL